jgi:hypothetical protein
MSLNNKLGKRRVRKVKQRIKKVSEGSSSGRVTTTVRGVTGVPDSIRTKLVYHDQITISGVTAGLHVFRGNSIYDPDFTSTGHQPLYTDYYDETYTKYKVLGSTITVELVNWTSADSPFLIVLPLTEAISSLSGVSFYELSELPRARMTNYQAPSGRIPIKIKYNMRTAVILGLMDGAIKDEDYSATFTNNPASIWYWNLALYCASGNNMLQYLKVSIVYDVLVYDRKEIPVSYKNITFTSEDEHKNKLSKESKAKKDKEKEPKFQITNLVQVVPPSKDSAF